MADHCVYEVAVANAQFGFATHDMICVDCPEGVCRGERGQPGNITIVRKEDNLEGVVKLTLTQMSCIECPPGAKIGYKFPTVRTGGGGW